MLFLIASFPNSLGGECKAVSDCTKAKYPGLVKPACVTTTDGNWSQCIDCNATNFENSCAFWGANLKGPAEKACGLKCHAPKPQCKKDTECPVNASKCVIQADKQWSQCVSCDKDAFQSACVHWERAEFLPAAEKACGLNCTGKVPPKLACRSDKDCTSKVDSSCVVQADGKYAQCVSCDKTQFGRDCGSWEKKSFLPAAEKKCGLQCPALAGSAPLAPTVTIAPGVNMPRINLGTCCGSEATNAFPAWFAAGGRGLDSASDYGKEVPGGKQTELSAAIVKVGAPRDQLFITTKIRAGLDALHGGPLCLGLGEDYALKNVRNDVAELGVATLDLVLLHAPCTSDAANLKLWKGLEQALALNLTRSIGVSNYNAKQLAALLAQATIKPAVNQCQMSVAHRDDDTLAYCAAHEIQYEAYEAMRGCPFSDAQVQGIATAHGVEVSQVCLRWVLQKGAVMAVGLGSDVSKMASYAKEDLDLYGFELTDAEMKLLDAVGNKQALVEAA